MLIPIPLPGGGGTSLSDPIPTTKSNLLSMMNAGNLTVAQGYKITDQGNAVVYASSKSTVYTISRSSENVYIAGMAQLVPLYALTQQIQAQSGNAEETLTSMAVLPDDVGINPIVMVSPERGLTLHLSGTEYLNVNADGQFLWSGTKDLIGDFADYILLARAIVANGNGSFTVFKEVGRGIA